ncbi:class I SAM-dependent methyltransferase [Ferruginibacter lapsinanis]|uniref:class I SAM-dependent methyltransferase n=1 Tax=Ferruginibacter lapsinanis TaxID=563172 RepID=UPI001E4B1958|nr:class I SAM-dependent methyltransferase [Ferruginibacter lapsinanis]UEG48532.1 class I SAM-dependent methyltransferase [Ferruginibacter lapsinanis]
MENATWFKDWFNSPYYHQLYFNRDEEEAGAFIDRLITHLKPPANSLMLDVACGKGRHSIHLAKMGFDVTGIDLSEDSITDALQYQTDKLHFFRHDMRLPFWINYYDYAFNFFTSFGYFNTQRENDNAIRTIAQSLKPTGTFVLDYLNVEYSVNKLIPSFTKEIDGVNYIITKWHDEKYFYKKIVIEDPQLKQPLIYTEKVAKFSLHDFTVMFAKQGLVIKEVFGDYHFGAYNTLTSPRLIVVAEKSANQ